MSYRNRLAKTVVGGLAASLLLTGCGTGTGAGNGAATTGAGSTSATGAACSTTKTKTISFWDQQFATIDVENAIAEYIATNGYCYPTKTYQLTSAVGNKSLADGQLDVDMELWRYNFMGWYTQATKSGQIVDLGQIYEKSTQGFYVPAYTVQAHPELKSVAQLNPDWQIFKDPLHPSQGLFINCQIGWHCHVSNIVKFQAYGLSQNFNIETPGSEGAEKAAIMGAYAKHQDFVFYWWAPTSLLAQIKVVQLQEPPFTDACNKLEDSVWNATNAGTPLNTALQKVTPAYGCGYQAYDIHKGVNAGLVKTAPDFVEFLKKMDVGNAPIEAASAYYDANGKDNTKAAMWFFAHYQKEWESWLPDDVAARVRAALIKNGVQLSSQ